MKWALPAADRYFQPILDQDPRGFQIDHLELALPYCRQFRLAVDGGAHIGTWTRTLAARFREVIAIEPAADTFKCLKENIADLPNVAAWRVALGDELRTGTVIDDVTRPGNTGARYVVDGGDVNIVPIDEYEFTYLDFLKLDVEGLELPALRGASHTLDRCGPVVMIEVKKLRPGCDPEDAVRFLNSIGYREVARARNDRVFTKAGL